MSVDDEGNGSPLDKARSNIEAALLKSTEGDVIDVNECASFAAVLTLLQPLMKDRA